MKNIYMVCLLGIVLTTLLHCTSDSKESIHAGSPDLLVIKDSIFVSPYGGYGYNIIINGEVKIHQPHIPVVPGQLGFASAQDARKTAQLVISKIEQDQFPPQLTHRELEDLGVVASPI
jgi:hypothetical protein